MTHKNVVHTFTWWQHANPMPQRTPLTPHDSFRYEPFMTNETKFISIWELLHNTAEKVRESYIPARESDGKVRESDILPRILRSVLTCDICNLGCYTYRQLRIHIDHVTCILNMYSLGLLDCHSRRSSKKIRRQSRRRTNRVDRSRSIFYHWPWPEFRLKAYAFTLPPIGHSSPSATETEDKEAFHRVHSVKSSGENEIFYS